MLVSWLEQRVRYMEFFEKVSKEKYVVIRVGKDLDILFFIKVKRNVNRIQVDFNLGYLS